MPRSRSRKLAPAGADATREEGHDEAATSRLPALREEAGTSPPTATIVLDGHGFMAALEHEIVQAHRGCRSSSLVMLRIDHFHRILGIRGRPMADRLLHQVAELIVGLLREVDRVALCDDDELAIILPHLDLIRARAVAEQLRDTIQRHHFEPRNDRITASLGVAELRGHHPQVQQLIASTRGLLAHARQLGNCIMTTDPGERAILRHFESDSKHRHEEACIIVTRGEGLGRQYDIAARQITIGRAPTNDIRIRHDTVSRTHATITADDTGVSIRDNESTNATFVNERKVQVKHLKHGDLIQIGPSILKFLMDSNAHSSHEGTLPVVDGLTQIFNRRYFTDTLEREVSRARRYERPLSLMMLDLDHFARCNEARGHRAGDHVLRQVAELLRDRSRKVDVVARHGGEEFAVILPEMKLESTIAFAETLREAIEQAVFEFEDEPISITVSIGVAELTPEITNADELVLLATERMHRAKQLGRNRVVSTHDSTSTRG